MGTRADFYVGRGDKAEWIGSIAWDGYPEGIVLSTEEKDEFGIQKSKKWPKGKHLFDAVTEREFRERVIHFFSYRSDVTLPDQGWPWPWEDSRTTDYAYAFDEGKVWASCFGHEWFDPLLPQQEDENEEPDEAYSEKTAIFPNMKSRQKVTLGPRSGVMVFRR